MSDTAIIKQITSYPKYLITEEGRVFSTWRHSKNPDGKLKEMKPYPDSSGYLGVRLFNESKVGKSFKIHKLVALMFLKENTNSLLQIDHIDNNKRNNHSSNLRWITQKANLLKKYNEDGYKIHFAKPVIQFNLKGVAKGFYPSALDAAKHNKLDASAISKACRGILNQTGGYKWEYDKRYSYN